MQEGESAYDTILRPIILEIRGYSNDKVFLKIARKIQETTPFEKLHPSIRVPLYETLLATDGMDDAQFEEMLVSYRTSVSPEIRKDLTLVLSSTKETSQIQLLLASLTDGTIRPQDVRRWLPRLFASSASRTMAWEWMQSSWDWLTSTFENDMTYSSFPTVAGRYLSTAAQREQFKVFFDQWRSVSALRRSIDLGDKELGATVAYINHNQPLLDKALQDIKEINQ